MTENAQRNREAEVNLLAAAREAQWSAAAFMGPNTMKLVSPAKVNLLLAIGARREDGYHDADTIMHALALHDTLYLCAEDISADELAKRTAEGASREDVAVGGPADNLVMTIDLADRTGQDLAVPAADNLAFKAADRLSRAVGRDLPEAIQLRIEKHIPAQGGLGGGSSNAAAVLVGLAKAWGLAADDERVADVARSLGADVAFFLHGGCALLGGVGEVLQRRLETSRRSVVLVKPAEGVCTAEAYKRFDAAPRPVPQDVLVCDLAATRADDVVLANNLAPAAEALLPELPSIREWLAEQAGSESVLLSGSGSATFALVDTFAGASRIATAATAPDEPLRLARRRRSRAVIMGFLARLSRVVPLLIVMAVAAGLIYVVVTYRHSPARAKEVLIKIFTWFNGVVVGFFALVSVYAFFDDAPAVLDLSLSFMIVGLVGLLITRIANWRFLKHNPNYRKKRLAATTRRRWPWGK